MRAPTCSSTTTAGRVLASDKRATSSMEPASITKLMTGLHRVRALREKRLTLDEMVHHQRTRLAQGGRLGGRPPSAQVGTQVPVEVLIKGMIVQSGNDATIALAEKFGGTEDGFVQMMNDYAQQLGMKNTHFENSWGGPGPNHYIDAHATSRRCRSA